MKPASKMCRSMENFSNCCYYPGFIIGYYGVGHQGKADYFVPFFGQNFEKTFVNFFGFSGQKSPNCRNFLSMSRPEDGVDLKKRRWGSFETSITQNFLASPFNQDPVWYQKSTYLDLDKIENLDDSESLSKFNIFEKFWRLM